MDDGLFMAGGIFVTTVPVRTDVMPPGCYWRESADAPWCRIPRVGYELRLRDEMRDGEALLMVVTVPSPGETFQAFEAARKR